MSTTASSKRPYSTRGVEQLVGSILSVVLCLTLLDEAAQLLDVLSGCELLVSCQSIEVQLACHSLLFAHTACQSLQKLTLA